MLPGNNKAIVDTIAFDVPHDLQAQYNLYFKTLKNCS